jgi:glyoxylase-like metal-dependent hydrolase (beta-lactamase superfamily II)
MTLRGEATHWSTDLGGGVRVGLVQAGTFRSDAGTLFGPVPRFMWQDLVAEEISPAGALLQALNCLLVETPGGRVLVETGIGERLDDRARQRRDVQGPAVVPALRAAGFEPESVDVVAMSHLHFDHAGGLLTADGRPAFARARIAAQRLEWQFALGDNPRLQASYEQGDLRLSAQSGGEGAVDGDVELLPGVEAIRTGGHSGGHQAILVRGTDRRLAFFGDLCMRPWSANPRWVTAFDDFPLTSVEVKARLFRQAVDENWTIVLSHEPAHPIGRLEQDRDRYRFVPVV